MLQTENFVQNKWVKGKGQGKPIFNAISGELITHVSSEGIEIGEMFTYARQIGNPSLRKLTFQERALMLKALAIYLTNRKDKYYQISYMTGATKVDSWIDIEGGIGNLFANASLRRKLPNQTFFIDGEFVPLSKEKGFIGQHIMVPKLGVAVHINAFNFPVWGMLEKIAVNICAGIPAIVKPAAITSYLTEVVFRDIIESAILPPGSLQLLVGSAYDILDYATEQDVITFTGSASTGQKLKVHPNVNKYSIPFNMEADSLNCCVLGTDVTPDSPEFSIFIKEVRKEMVIKAGQKCTAIRRIIVPESIIKEVEIALTNALKENVIGDPQIDGVKMGALASKEQVNEVREKVKMLMTENDVIYGDYDHFEIKGADKNKGNFFPTILMRQKYKGEMVHEIEAFGPVSTIITYQNVSDAIELANRGRGSLVSSVITNQHSFATEYTLGIAPYHGRILILNRECSKESTGHGSPMPMLVHGGPGRAGGGEEMGGLRGLKHYMQRCAIQGSPTFLTEITQVYQPGSKHKTPKEHPFRIHFDDLNIGDTIITHKRTITENDIINFGNLSWDHFYAHTDITSLDGTIFTERVAHGYFILSAAAGLFVDPSKGPVLLNYGLEECRFLKPVYSGTTIGVKLSVKEKIKQEKKDGDEIEKGIVKFYVEVYDQSNETVAIATILTMVKIKTKTI